MEIESDPLDEIFVDENEPADKRIIADILKPFATIDSKGVIAFTEEYNSLKESKKVLVYLLCKKAMVLKGLQNISEKATVKEIAENAIVSESNAKNALFTYFKGIVKDAMIPNYNLKKVKEVILEN
jgi:hypothetical protein